MRIAEIYTQVEWDAELAKRKEAQEREVLLRKAIQEARALIKALANVPLADSACLEERALKVALSQLEGKGI